MVVGAWMPPVMVILGIPFTLQVLFSLMAGIVIGKNRGALSQIIYLLIGLIGLPVFAQFKGGLGAVVSPTFGFLLGFILGAFLSGLLYQKLKIANDFLRALVSTLCGTVAIYAAGIAISTITRIKSSAKEWGLEQLSPSWPPSYYRTLSKLPLQVSLALPSGTN